MDIIFLEISPHRGRGIKNRFLEAGSCNLNLCEFYILVHEVLHISFFEWSKWTHVYHSYLITDSITFPIALAMSGGTALPTSVY